VTSLLVAPRSAPPAAYSRSNRARLVRLLHRCFDTWRGIGDVVAGMARQGYDLELRRYDGRGWRAMFFLSGSEHSLTADAGSAWAPSPWEAAQRAATDALYKLRCGEPPPPDCTTTNDSPAWPSAPVHIQTVIDRSIAGAG
jgi:hypothetical protein